MTKFIKLHRLKDGEQIWINIGMVSEIYPLANGCNLFFVGNVDGGEQIMVSVAERAEVVVGSIQVTSDNE